MTGMRPAAAKAVLDLPVTMKDSAVVEVVDLPTPTDGMGGIKPTTVVGDQVTSSIIIVIIIVRKDIVERPLMRTRVVGLETGCNISSF